MELINAFLFFISSDAFSDATVVAVTIIALWFVWFIAEIWLKWLFGDFEYHGFDASNGARFRWW